MIQKEAAVAGEQGERQAKMSEQNDESKGESCGPDCCCGTAGGGSGKKWMICGAVALAAVVVVAAHVSRTRAADTPKHGYAAAMPVVAPANVAKPALNAGVWGVPLKALAELNLVASNTEAVFVVVPSSDGDRTVAIQKEVTAAAATLITRRTKIGTFILSQDSQEYAGLAKQIGAPAVIAMCKGGGMASVQDKQVTQESLLKAFVGASRPSGCGPSGCGPGGCN